MIDYIPNYNERSWAIDLIGHIKLISSLNNRSIKDAGGEQTIRANGSSLFPDVLLFGDQLTARILQGWELKMPDTEINDFAFKENAEAKARALGLDSFLLWNVSVAQLYVRGSSDEFSCIEQWNDLQDITTRNAVIANSQRWKSLASKIISHLNDLFDRGTLEGRQFIDAYQSGGITALMMDNAGDSVDSIKAKARTDADFRNEMIVWWDRYGAEYASGNMEAVLAQAVISNWIGKILFANILKETDNRAQQVSQIDENTTPQQALDLFRQLSEDCNFWTIFSDSLGLNTIPARVWSHLKQFNHLLSDLRIGAVDQQQLSRILEATVEVAVRKLRGQYPTPIELARLLVHLSVRNLESDRLLDPCCGSGTIPRAALELKLSAGIEPRQAASTIYASDQDPQAVQIATFALAHSDLMHIPLRIFKQDAFTLNPDQSIEFRNPSDGSLFTELLGNFQAITSNLPFVAQAGRKQYGNALKNVHTTMLTGADFTKRADVSAYLPFSLCPLLAAGGRLGIIITNAWLGTEWGDNFYDQLKRYYDLKFVITSGAGRWFKNSEVVTNILIMDKKSDAQQESGEIKFVVLTRPLSEMQDLATARLAAAQIQIGRTQTDTMTIRSVTQTSMVAFRKLGLGGNAQFVQCNWLLTLPLIGLKDIFRITRGAKTWDNDFFYPPRNCNIENEYLEPLVKSPTQFKRLSVTASSFAFSCSRTKDELQQLGHNGALAWINRFETPERVAKLTKVKSRNEKFWYTLDTRKKTDLVMFINFGERLFVGRVNPKEFVDQRLVPLEPINDIDVELHHALLNSAISMFIHEGLGFGRGLGALDLNKDRIERYMHMLDASQLDEEGIIKIKEAFLPLTQRDILSVADELEQPDRIAFDNAIIEVFKLAVTRIEIYDALLSLMEIRRTVTEPI